MLPAYTVHVVVVFLVFFLCVLSRIFFNTALRSPKVGKNVDKSPSRSCRVKMFSKSNHVVIWCCLLPQFVGS